MMDALRVELLEMADVLSHLGLWVKLNVPRAEDGNNFGVLFISDAPYTIANPDLLACRYKYNQKYWMCLVLLKLLAWVSLIPLRRNNILIAQSEETLILFFVLIPRYHASRAKSIQKVLKWPLLEDHRVAVSQMDEKIYI
jgi:hypothetical protein